MKKILFYLIAFCLVACSLKTNGGTILKGGNNYEIFYEAENGATITLTVSTGPEIKKVKVPDLRGMTESAAKSKLAEYGLNCGTVSETYSDTVTEIGRAHV